MKIEQSHIQTPLLSYLAQKENKVLTFLDLETTTFLGQPDFGVTEIAAIHIYPDGYIDAHSALLNPEHPIRPEVVEITGICDEMVKDQPNWKDGDALKLTEYWAKNHICIGFNTLGFDFPGIQYMNKKYGNVDTKFTYPRDVRSLWRWLSGRAKGKLGVIAQRYGLNPDGAHRALFDVEMTAIILEFFLQDYGVEFFYHPAFFGSPNQQLHNDYMYLPGHTDNISGFLSKKEIVLGFIRQGKTPTEIDKLTLFGSRYIQDAITDLIDDGYLDAAKYRNQMAQSWLKIYVPRKIENAWKGDKRGRLKPIMDELGFNKPTFVNYFQLKIFLIEHGYLAAVRSGQLIEIFAKEQMRKR